MSQMPRLHLEGENSCKIKVSFHDPNVFPNMYDFLFCMGWKIRFYVHAALFYTMEVIGD